MQKICFWIILSPNFVDICGGDDDNNDNNNNNNNNSKCQITCAF